MRKLIRYGFVACLSFMLGIFVGTPKQVEMKKETAKETATIDVPQKFVEVTNTGSKPIVVFSTLIGAKQVMRIALQENRSYHFDNNPFWDNP
jgi:hypothetical protein